MGQYFDRLSAPLLSVLPIGRLARMCCAEFFGFAGERVRENWIQADILDVCVGFRIDVLGRMRTILPREWTAP